MQTIPIMFQGGSYGSYLIWLLTMLFTDNELHDPFIPSNGSSHNLKQLSSFQIADWLADQSCYPKDLFLKIHPKMEKHHSFYNNACDLTTYFGKSILMYPSKSTYLLHSNNFVYKTRHETGEGPLAHVNKDDLYNNFPVDENTPLEELPNWITREWLSYGFFNSMNDQIEWFLPDRLVDKNCLIIFIDELLYDLNHTVEKIQKFINLPLIKNINDVLPYHTKNLSLQKYLNQDVLASNIIESIKINNESLSWNREDLTIISEAWIQQWIRNAGYDFKCFELNQFPTSSKELIQLL